MSKTKGSRALKKASSITTYVPRIFTAYVLHIIEAERRNMVASASASYGIDDGAQLLTLSAHIDGSADICKSYVDPIYNRRNVNAAVVALASAIELRAEHSSDEFLLVRADATQDVDALLANDIAFVAPDNATIRAAILDALRVVARVVANAVLRVGKNGMRNDLMNCYAHLVIKDQQLLDAMSAALGVESE